MPEPWAGLRALEEAAAAQGVSWRGPGALVVVGHSDCETSRLALRYAERLHRRRRDGRAVVAVLQDEPGEARAMAGELELTLPVVLDRDPHPLGAALQLSAVPALFLLHRDGTLEESFEAFRRADFERLAEALDVPPPFFGEGDDAPVLRPG